MNNFIRLVGEPDEIYINLATAPGATYIQYMTYYDTERIMIAVSPGSRNGPDPNDLVYALFLNTEFDRANLLAEGENFQPWLGYGHLKDYLPGVQTPPTGLP